MGARDQPLLFVITTNGFVRGGIFDTQYQYACDILEGKADNPPVPALPVRAGRPGGMG